MISPADRSPRKPSQAVAGQLIQAAMQLRAATAQLRFSLPVTHVYNPLDYAWQAHEAYLTSYARSRKRVLFLGMNPGPFGMTQTGVPFGEVRAVREWLGISRPVGRPKLEHAKRPVVGFDCPRSEVSGRRLWGLFAQRFGSPQNFFSEHFVANYCPLVFLEASGCNRTPDKLPASEQGPLLEVCDLHLRAVVETLQPEWLIGVGRFAAERAQEVLGDSGPRIGAILHPSPANPAANRDWEGTVVSQLLALGVWR